MKRVFELFKENPQKGKEKAEEGYELSEKMKTNSEFIKIKKDVIEPLVVTEEFKYSIETLSPAKLEIEPVTKKDYKKYEAIKLAPYFGSFNDKDKSYLESVCALRIPVCDSKIYKELTKVPDSPVRNTNFFETTDFTQRSRSNNEPWVVHPTTGQTAKKSRSDELSLNHKAAEYFAVIIFFMDGLLAMPEKRNSEVSRFLKILSQLPMNLHMQFSHILTGSTGTMVLTKYSEPAFKKLKSACETEAKLDYFVKFRSGK
jgi:hypothetical protein